MAQSKLAAMGLYLPPVIFGTSGLGNLFTALDDDIKLQIVKESIEHSAVPAVFDSAGKYGAGLALETIGKCLRTLQRPPESVIISNKLGWYRVPLTTPEPTFEPGVWKNLQYDAVQKISYTGIIKCFEQGNELLGGYNPHMVSVHDPDEYLATAANAEEEKKLYQDILDAYKALSDLKAAGKVKAIGVGAKNWRIIKKIAMDVELDWVMIANSMTIHYHPAELLAFMEELKSKGVYIINSAIFHAGFLMGGTHYDYKLIQPDNPEHKAIFAWREKFFELCNICRVKPAEACARFSLSAPGVGSLALNTTNPSRVKQNIDLANAQIPEIFWQGMRIKGLISSEYSYL
jgi:D-threo-aldose 1-dehydrogenase